MQTRVGVCNQSTEYKWIVGVVVEVVTIQRIFEILRDLPAKHAYTLFIYTSESIWFLAHIVMEFTPYEEYGMSGTLSTDLP